MDDREFGKYLKSLREKQRMSLREAERESGVSNAYIAQIERGDGKLRVGRFCVVGVQEEETPELQQGE